MENLQTLSSLAKELPAKVATNAQNLIERMGTVIEGIGDEPVEWRPPMLRLVQGTTDRGSIPKGTAIGSFVLGEKVLEQPMQFIPIRIWDARQYWDPDQTSNRILCWSPDSKLGSMFGECGTCKHRVWNEEEGGSDCGKLKSALVINNDLSEVFTVNFAKSNYKIGMELESTMRKAGVNSYARTYALSSTTSSSAKNVEIFKLEVLDEKLRKTPAEYIAFLKELFTKVSADRKSSLDSFYENTKRRMEQIRLSGDTPVAIENAASTDSGKSEIAVTAEKSSVSELAKGYTI